MIYLLAGLLALLCFSALLWPLFRKSSEQEANLAVDVSLKVYTDQLERLVKDQAAGRLGIEEAKASETEIKRRILAANRNVSPTRWQANTSVTPVILVALGLVVLGSLTYVSLGSPGLPDQHFEQRLLVAANDPAADPVARLYWLEQRRDSLELAANLRVEAAVEVTDLYLRIQEPIRALESFRVATKITPKDPLLWSAYAEVLYITGQEQGLVPEAARQAVAQALRLDPTEPRALFIGGLIAMNDGNYIPARAMFEALQRRVPKGELLAEIIAQRLDELTMLEASDDQPGPTKEDVEAVSQMAPEDREAMIEGMVQGLADRLVDEPDDIQGWLRLANAYLVLGQAEQAADALANVPNSNPVKQGLEARLKDLAVE